MTVDLARCIPILASLDIAETAAFYTEQLGFAVGCEDANYLIVKRNDMELHFWKTQDRQLPENTSCYIRGAARSPRCTRSTRCAACPKSRRSRCSRGT